MANKNASLCLAAIGGFLCLLHTGFLPYEIQEALEICWLELLKQVGSIAILQAVTGGRN